MENQNSQKSGTYEVRWFIWTIVFLAVAGVGLITYIATSNSGAEAVSFPSKTQSTRLLK